MSIREDGKSCAWIFFIDVYKTWTPTHFIFLWFDFIFSNYIISIKPDEDYENFEPSFERFDFDPPKKLMLLRIFTIIIKVFMLVNEAHIFITEILLK